mgnify:CR=1 FL=1
MIVGLDIGTCWIRVAIAEIDEFGHLRIAGTSCEKSVGLRNGNIVNIEAASNAIRNAIESAEQNAGVEHSQHESTVAKDGMGADRIENAHHEYRDSGLIEHFLAVGQCDEHEKQGGCYWQNDLAPHFQLIPCPFHTGDRNAGHCRADQAQCHQPCQHIFTADI